MKYGHRSRKYIIQQVFLYKSPAAGCKNKTQESEFLGYLSTLCRSDAH